VVGGGCGGGGRGGVGGWGEGGGGCGGGGGGGVGVPLILSEGRIQNNEGRKKRDWGGGCRVGGQLLNLGEATTVPTTRGKIWESSRKRWENYS